MEKPRIYISGPISGYDIDERRKAFSEAARRIQTLGYETVDPIAEADAHPEDKTTQDHMRRDIELILTCDYIYMMRRWTHSKGCMVELQVATSIGLTVIFEETGDVILFE